MKIHYLDRANVVSALVDARNSLNKAAAIPAGQSGNDNLFKMIFELEAKVSDAIAKVMAAKE
jgi:hypothetical protein